MESVPIWPRSFLCGCCTLRAGASGIGLLHLTLHTIAAVSLSALLASPETLRAQLAVQPEVAPAGQPAPADLDTLLGLARLLGWTGLVLVLLSALVDAALLYGARRRRPGPLLVWLVWYGLVTGLQTLAALLALVAALTEPAAELWGLAAAGTAGTVLGWYFFAVVLSFFFQLRQQESDEYGIRPIMT